LEEDEEIILEKLMHAYNDSTEGKGGSGTKNMDKLRWKRQKKKMYAEDSFDSSVNGTNMVDYFDNQFK